MNVASFLGDISHVVATFLIIGWLVRKKTAEGISGKMQVLYAIVFTTRYLDLFTSFISYYNTFMKIFFIITAYLTVYLIYIAYKKTYEREHDAFWIEALIVLCLGLGLLECYDITMPEEVLWAFSRYLEAVVFIPQLYFTYKKELKSNLITYYTILLILYRTFYIANWIIRYQLHNQFDPFTVYPGLLQFFLYFIYFLLPSEPKSNTLPVTVEETAATSTPPTAHVPIPPRSPHPHLARQESLLETPFLKRNAASYTSIYTIGMDSKNTSPNGSVSNLSMAAKPEGRY